MSVKELKELEHQNAALQAANDELKDQVRLLQTIFANISEGVVATNLKGEFLAVNETAIEIVGMGPTETAPEEWSEVYGTFYPDKVTTVPHTELPLYKAMQGEITDNVVLFIRNQNRPNGVFINVSGRPLYDEADNLIGGVIVLHDITELKMTEEKLTTTVDELKVQTQVMDAIFNSISDGVVVSDENGKYVLFNQAAKQMAGYDPTDVHTIYAPETFGLFETDGESLFPVDKLPIAQALQGESTDNVEMLIRNSQMPWGVSVGVSARPIYNEKGVVTGAVSAIHDISELKEKEQQLETLNDQLTDQSEFMESIFNSISDGIIVTDSSGCVTFFNRGAHRIARSDVSTEALEKWQREYEYFHLDRVTPYTMEELPLMQAIHGKSTDNVEIFIRNPELQDEIYVSASGRPLQDSNGTQKGGVVIFHDITGRVRSEEAVAQAFTQGRLEIVDTILHNIGNAINSVTIGIDTIHTQLNDDQLVSRLTALATALEQHKDDLSDYIKNDPQGQKALPFISMLAHDFSVMFGELQERVERIRNRTGHIVDIIRTQKSYHSTSGTHKDINLTVAISDAVKILQDAIDKRQIQIDIDCENAPEEIHIQESQFHQMLVNLIKNSIEAIEDRAAVGELNEVPRIQCRTYINADFLCIDITDNGSGIAPENTQRVFSAGFTTKEQGSGLGLHASANFVISSGGRIQPISAGKGKGTTMHVMLPYHPIQTSKEKVRIATGGGG